MATNESRHVRYSERKLRHDKRVKQRYGEKEDRSKFFTCWNCGFICNMDRDALGDADTMSNIGTIDVTVTQDGVTDATDLRNPVKVPDINSGCPLCGTLNWK